MTLRALTPFFIAIATCSYAQSDAPIESLSEPVTLLTYGLDKIESELNMDFKNMGIHVEASYKSGSKLLVVSSSCDFCNMRAEEKDCNALIEMMRSRAFVFDGKSDDREGSRFSRKFFNRNSYNANKAIEIDELIMLSARITEMVENKPKFISCYDKLFSRGSLIGTKK